MNYAIYNDTGDSFCISFDTSKNELKDHNRIIKIVQILRAMEIIEQNEDWLNRGKAIKVYTGNRIVSEKIDE